MRRLSPEMKEARRKDHRVYMLSNGLRILRGKGAHCASNVKLTIVPPIKIIKARFGCYTHILYSDVLDDYFQGKDLE